MATTARVIPFPDRRPDVSVNGRHDFSQGTGRPDPAVQEARHGEELLVQWSNGLLLDAITARNRVITTSEWRDNDLAYWGNTWPDALPSYKSPIQINELKKLILQDLGDLTDNSPTVYITAQPQAKDRATEVERAIHAYWQRQFLDLIILDVCLDASIWPCGFLEVLWDPLAQQGQGEIVVRARAPQTVYPDPYATDDEDWRYVVTQDVMDINEVRQKWPDQGWRVLPDAARPSDPQPMLMPPERPSGVGLMTPLYPVNAPVPTHGADTRVVVNGIRVKDATLEVVPQLVRDAQGVEHLRRSVRYKYPQGRLMHFTSHVMLYDGGMPYGDGFDLLRVTLQPAVHRFWPERSLVAELLELQRAGDKMDSLVLENALRLQKGLVLATANSGIDQRTFADIPGQVIFYHPSGKVEIVRPPPLPADLVQAGDRWRQKMQGLMGQQPSRQGMPGRGNVSAELTETEISQAMGLTRLRARFLYKAISKLTSKLLARMGQFYTTERVLPFVEGEQWSPVLWQPLLDWRQYSAFIDPNSFSVQSKTLVKRLALGLAKMGRMASDEDLYEILEFPKGKQIAERNKQQLQLMAQAAQAQKGRAGHRRR